ncbi:uncharacterized protein [Littorina saxatilis]|uniref:Uncharacterized protein n=2 Tax=Littorina saxatilis TaxID=31220 RepID=A0AAN9GGQ1_9CAEN
MRTIIALLILSMVAATFASHACQGNGKMLQQFNGRKESTAMPCKYHAVRTKCGKYFVNLTPGNIFVHPKYRLNTLWLGVRELDTDKEWEGRTDNKVAVKFFNGWKSELFNKKDGVLNTEDVLTFSKDAMGTHATAKNGDFKVTFVPWDPENDNFPLSKWRFECNADDFEPASYPDQVCGSADKRETVERTEMLGFDERTQTVFHDVFTNTNITQTNPKCANATMMLTEMCTEQQRKTAIITCGQILSSLKHTKCLTKYTCDPMDVFVDCIDWVCSDFSDDAACERVGMGIDMCRTFRDGNLTMRVENAKCYTEFLPIMDTPAMAMGTTG